jgi:hypothetical protein
MRALFAIALVFSLATFGVTQAQTGNDGTYTGNISVKTDNHMGRQPCGFLDTSRTLTIQGGKFAFIFNPQTSTIIINGSVDGSGQLSGSGTSPAGGVSMKGTIQAGNLTADITTAYCVFTVQLKK